MDETLHAAFEATDYRVRLACGGVAHVSVGRPLPGRLRAAAGQAPWGLITAWNPRSQPMPESWNRAAQRRLLADLRALPGPCRVHAAVGVGTDGWRERSLFVIGPALPALLDLARRYRQHAIVAGCGRQPAILRWPEAPAG